MADGAGSNIVRRVRESPVSRVFDLLVPASSSEADLLASVSPADAILAYEAHIPATVIRAAPALKLIQKHGLNCRKIDVAAATERNVRVATIPLLRSVSVAEHALAMMLACVRKIVPGHRAVTQAVYRQMGLEPVVTAHRTYRSNWARIEGMGELFRTTVGIVGMGDIGMEIAKRCRAFAMNIRYYQRTRHPQTTEDALGMTYLPFDELLAEADYVVLVLPHTPDTEGIIGARELALMKESATLVNVGRGGLIDEDALTAALRDKRIAMAALDVYRREPLPADSPLLTLPNVLLLPHTGGGSYRSWKLDTPAVLRNIALFFEGKAEGVVNG
jgi:phosphoglycerate dehydrogenase-like enzyme